MRKQKGFTLIEMVIVIAIIGILTSIIIPTWSYFIMKANLRTQNNYSKVIFNAAQTQATRYEIKEKRDFSSAKDGDTEAKKNLYLASDFDVTTGDFEYCIYWDGKNAYRLDADGEKLAADTNQDATDAFADSINRVFGESGVTVYKVYIKNYKVESVCSARGEGSDIIGSFPVSQDKRSENDLMIDGKSVDAINVDMTKIDLT